MPLRPFPYPFQVGTDICNVSRLRAVLTRDYGGEPLRPLHQYLRRVLTDHERQYFWNRFGPEEAIAKKMASVSQFLAGRFAAKEACRKACSHLDMNARGFKHIMILPVTSVDRSKHQSSRPRGLILDKVYETYTPAPNDPAKSDNARVAIQHVMSTLVDVSELDGQLCEISISHDGDFATAVAIVLAVGTGLDL
ncbi:holo-[acyl-carrier protein] synthase [Alternaria panax]|uniref:Holo-[acyl-carrier protein] synthase n=1 Tax=Alternaria panax TaxID=48097 RepID=A0AAD4IC70_9PLEO|nr:holo-[acyl-carrier protein] synthase [Alternaria panax]